jgi:hypothetical protein
VASELEGFVCLVIASRFLFTRVCCLILIVDYRIFVGELDNCLQLLPRVGHVGCKVCLRNIRKTHTLYIRTHLRVPQRILLVRVRSLLFLYHTWTSVTSLKSFRHLLKSSELILSKILALVIPSKIIAFVMVKDLKDDFIFLVTIFHLRSQLLGLLGQEISIEFCLVILNPLSLLFGNQKLHRPPLLIVLFYLLRWLILRTLPLFKPGYRQPLLPR